jgi:CHRD domain.
MGINTIRGCLWKITIALLLFFHCSCKQTQVTDDTKIKPPIRSYIVIARVDKKGTNSNSEGKAMLSGFYDEASRVLDYTLEYKDLIPEVITLRSGAKGSVGTIVKQLYKNEGKNTTTPLKGSLTLSPLQERDILKGRWFIAISTLTMNPEISGILTLKQK